jgi:hypothetical protein
MSAGRISIRSIFIGAVPGSRGACRDARVSLGKYRPIV